LLNPHKNNCLDSRSRPANGGGPKRRGRKVGGGQKKSQDFRLGSKDSNFWPAFCVSSSRLIGKGSFPGTRPLDFSGADAKTGGPRAEFSTFDGQSPNKRKGMGEKKGGEQVGGRRAAAKQGGPPRGASDKNQENNVGTTFNGGGGGARPLFRKGPPGLF